jgi:hypothetical protein
MATKDKGGSKRRKKARGEEPQTRAPDQEVEPIDRDYEVVRRIRVDDAARATRAAPQGIGNVRVVAIRVLGASGFT